MKLRTAFISSLLFLSLLFTACNDDAHTTDGHDRTDTSSSTTSADHLRMYFEGLHPSDQKALFFGLPPEMRHALWMSHLHSELKKAKNDQERAFIQDVIGRLKPAYYSDSALYRKEGAAYFRAQAAKLLSVFSNDTMRAAHLMYRIGGDPDAARILQADQPECICNMDDDWCGSGKICSTDNCKRVLIGCGWWGLEPCDGWCLHKRPDQ